MAQAIKDRDNPNMIGMVTGKVISPPPSLAVSIMEGQIVIKNAYIADYLLKGYTRRVNIKTAAADGSTNSASCSDGSHSHKVVTAGIPDTDVATLDELKTGDTVIVYSSYNQNYFILGKAVRAGEL